MDKIEISLAEANEELERLGLKPFLIKSLTINARDENHLKASVNKIIEQLEDWVINQQEG